MWGGKVEVDPGTVITKKPFSFCLTRIYSVIPPRGVSARAVTIYVCVYIIFLNLKIVCSLSRNTGGVVL